MASPDQSNLLRRAIELASSGQCPTVTSVKQRLRSEGYEKLDAHLGGLGMRRKLQALVKQAAVPPSTAIEPDAEDGA